MGTLTHGTKAPTITANPPMSSTRTVAQLMSSGAGTPMACSMLCAELTDLIIRSGFVLQSAAAIGLEGIGTLDVGMPADIIVYDLQKLGIAIPEPVYEQIVGGGKRLIERAVGYRAIIVNGVMTFEHDKCTGKLPGRVVRTSAYQPGSSARTQKNVAAAH
jgi:cytosine/adenosine deaminase-related metal-dependent hydrolase